MLNPSPLIFLLLILEIWNFVSWKHPSTWPEVFLQRCVLHHFSGAGRARWPEAGQPGTPGQPWASGTSGGTGLGRGRAGVPGCGLGLGTALERGTGVKHSPWSTQPTGLSSALTAPQYFAVLAHPLIILTGYVSQQLTILYIWEGFVISRGSKNIFVLKGITIRSEKSTCCKHQAAFPTLARVCVLWWMMNPSYRLVVFCSLLSWPKAWRTRE